MIQLAAELKQTCRIKDSPSSEQSIASQFVSKVNRYYFHKLGEIVPSDQSLLALAPWVEKHLPQAPLLNVLKFFELLSKSI